MARKAKSDKAAENGFDKERLTRLVGSIENHFEELESELGVYRAKCKSIRESIDACYSEAKAFGIPTKELRAVVNVRKLERKLAAQRDKLETEERETFDQIRHALGDLADTPLGRAATGEKADDERDFRPAFLREDAHVETNVRRLRGGITKLTE